MDDKARGTGGGAPGEAGGAQLTAEEKRERMRALRWFHSLDLGDGIVTPGVKPRERLAFQSDRVFRHPVAGQSVLDIGCWDGHFSFEARRRGGAAPRASSPPTTTSGTGPAGGSRAAFELARAAIDPGVEAREIPFEEMTPETLGVFDVVLFLGVLYHMKDPLGAVERAAALARRVLVVESHVDARLAPQPPAMVLYPFDELDGDPSNWWGPNPSCVAAMLRTCGFRTIEQDTDYRWPGSSRALFHAFR